MFQNISPEQEIDARGHVNASTLAHPSANRIGASGGRSDEALITAVAAGDADAMPVLLERHNVRIILFVRLISGAGPAENIVGEVLADVWRQTSKFKGRSQVPTWILSIARFEALWERGRRYDAELDEAVALLIADESDTPEEAVLKMDRSAQMRLCLTQLSTEHAKSSTSSTTTKRPSRRSSRSARCRGKNLHVLYPQAPRAACCPPESRSESGLGSRF
jgi:DNA-directed RNA polymerase specialized sigma24 family protein